MVTAYVMIKLIAGKDEEVFTKIKNLGKLKQVTEANATYGAFDLVIEGQFKTIEELDRFIFEEIRRLPNVTETSSMIVAKKIV
jgi:DNA-binding Lrp family transcriptional regulator